MSKIGRPSLKTIIKGIHCCGLAAVMLSTGIPAHVYETYAEPVTVNSPQLPSFADVVSAVSPAVVSVRVKSDTTPASDDAGNGFSFNFGGRGFDDLPDDHPLKRFYQGVRRPDAEWQEPGSCRA